MATLKAAPMNPFLDHLAFGQTSLNPSTLSVATENYTASRPPIRNLNVTDEILNLLRTYQVKQTIAKIFEDAPPTHSPVFSTMLNLTRRLRMDD